jgi:hypothetical protein
MISKEPFTEEDFLTTEIELIAHYYAREDATKEGLIEAVIKLIKDYGKREPNSFEIDSASDNTVSSVLSTSHEDLDTSLRLVTRAIEEYEGNPTITGERICEHLQVISSHLFFLEVFRSHYHSKWNRIVYNFQGAVSRAEVEANEQVPELYMLRRVLGAANKTMDAMRSQLSAMKHEINSSR